MGGFLSVVLIVTSTTLPTSLYLFNINVFTLAQWHFYDRLVILRFSSKAVDLMLLKDTIGYKDSGGTLWILQPK